MQRISPFRSTPAGVFELAGFPHVCFNLSYFFLVLEEEAGGLAVACNLGGKGQLADMFERRFEPVKVVSTKLETPEIILGVPWALPLIVVRDCIQGSSILTIVSGNNTNDMGIRPHDQPSVACWNAPPPVIGDDAVHVVDPTIEIKA